jgi:lycopene cyclase domain-containing protein
VSYAALDAIFLGVAVVVGVVAVAVEARAVDGGVAAVARRWWAPAVIAGVTVLVLTAVFDNVLIAAGMFSYARAHISGLHIGAAPVEDFAYPIAGLILLPSLWSLLRGRRR